MNAALFKPLTLLLIALLALGLGCRDDDQDPAAAPESATGGPATSAEEEQGLSELGEFFDESRLLEGALDLGDESMRVECVGATEEERTQIEHPRILRGFVLAPDGRLALRRETLLDRLIPSAHAAPLEDERPVADVRVYLTRVDAIGEPTGEVLLETKSSLFGEWCLRLPDDVDFHPSTMLIAEAGDQRLRRPVLHRSDLDIYSQPEALVRLLVEEGHLFTELDVDTYLNLDVMAQTAVDLLAPVEVRPGAGLESLLARLDRTLRDDERLMAALKRVRAARPDED